MKNYSPLIKVISLLLLCCYLSLANAAAPREFILDTDVGIDDVIAMLYLFQDRQIAIKAITIETNGNAHCAAAFRNTAGVLRLLGVEHVPIACGSEVMIKGGHTFPAAVLARDDNLLGSAGLLPQTNLKVTHNAVGLLIKTIRHSKNPISILAIGPLTNLAKAYQAAPDIKNKIKQIYVMGGAVHVPGNIQDTVANLPNTAEWNMYFDPVSADIVLAHLPVVLVPLDVTNQAPINEEFLQRITGAKPTPAYEYLYQILKNSEADIRTGLWYFFDPLAAVVASDESFCEFKNEKIRVVRGSAAQGTTIVDKLKGTPIKICENIKVKDFEDKLLKVIAQAPSDITGGASHNAQAPAVIPAQAGIHS